MKNIVNKYSTVVLDIDGTLLNSDHKLTKNTKQKILELSRDVNFILATGKKYFTIKNLIKELDIPGYHITCDGAAIYDSYSNELVLKKGISYSSIENIVEFLESNGVTFILSYEDYVYTKEFNVDIEHSLSYGDPYPIFYRSSSDLPDKDLTHILVITHSNQSIESNIFQELISEYSKEFNIVRSSENFMEILNREASKGNALDYILEKINVDRKEVVGIGDGENDISFLRNVGLSIAMGNASNLVKENCMLTTKHTDDEGVLSTLNYIFKN